MRRAAALPALLLAVALAACADAAGPVIGDLTGTYVLRDVAGDPLPATVNEVEGGIVEARADTLRFGPDGRGTITRAYAFVHADGRRDEVVPIPSPFSYELRDGRVVVSLDCPIDALAICVDGPHVILQPDGDDLRAEYVLGLRVPQRYERVVEP